MLAIDFYYNWWLLKEPFLGGLATICQRLFLGGRQLSAAHSANVRCTWNIFPRLLFPARTVRFHSSELENRNCMGSRGKVPLEPSKLERVKHYTFRMYPTPSTQKEQQWKKCIIAIDETLRRKKK